MFCELTQLENGRWYCPACDPQRERTLPARAGRNCGPPAAQVPEQILASIRVFCPDCPRSPEELSRLVARCCACDEYAHGCTRGRCGRRWEQWRAVLAYGRCNRWP